MILYMNKEMGLNDLSDSLGKNKSTISHHLSILKNKNIINEREEKARGQIKKKFFSVSPNFLKEAILNINDLGEMDSKMLQETLLTDIEMDSHLMGFIQMILNNLMKNYENLQKQIQSIEQISNYNVKNLYNKFKFKMFCVPLDEEDKEDFMREYDELEKRFMERQRLKKKKENEAKPYVAWHFLVPMDILLD
jgi:DNA-binding transcriptional regulator GbsR (MarR family)